MITIIINWMPDWVKYGLVILGIPLLGKLIMWGLKISKALKEYYKAKAEAEEAQVKAKATIENIERGKFIATELERICPIVRDWINAVRQMTNSRIKVSFDMLKEEDKFNKVDEEVLKTCWNNLIAEGEIFHDPKSGEDFVKARMAL